MPTAFPDCPGYREKVAELVAQKPVIEARIAELAEEQSAAAQKYAALFAPAGIVPVGPDAMIAWLVALDDLKVTRRDADVLADQIASLEALGRQVHAALLAIGRNIGVSGVEAMPPLALSRLINAALDEMTAKWTARLTFEGARQAARMRVGQIEDALYKARREHKEWQEKFEAMLPHIGLRKGRRRQPGGGGRGGVEERAGRGQAAHQSGRPHRRHGARRRQIREERAGAGAGAGAGTRQPAGAGTDRRCCWIGPKWPAPPRPGRTMPRRGWRRRPPGGYGTGGA